VLSRPKRLHNAGRQPGVFFLRFDAFFRQSFSRVDVIFHNALD
jgi:hypothetical protein